MKYVIGMARFILTSAVALILVLLIAGCRSARNMSSLQCPRQRPIRKSTSFIQGDRPVAARAPWDQTSRGSWWEIFGDPELNKLEEQIASSNQNLKWRKRASAKLVPRFALIEAPSFQPSPLRPALAMSRVPTIAELSIENPAVQQG